MSKSSKSWTIYSILPQHLQKQVFKRLRLSWLAMRPTVGTPS